MKTALAANVKKQRRKAYLKGLYGEYFAAIYLSFKGYRILERRFKTPAGEIDLVVTHGQTLVFVEVKTRNTIDDALSCFHPEMERRITRAANFFLSRYPGCNQLDMRFDFIAVAPFFHIRHLDNAWRPPA